MKRLAKYVLATPCRLGQSILTLPVCAHSGLSICLSIHIYRILMHVSKDIHIDAVMAVDNDRNS